MIAQTVIYTAPMSSELPTWTNMLQLGLGMLLISMILVLPWCVVGVIDSVRSTQYANSDLWEIPMVVAGVVLIANLAMVLCVSVAHFVAWIW